MGPLGDFEILTINPKEPHGPKIAAVVPLGLIERYYKYRSVDFENLRAAKYVLENPQRIFSVLREFGDEERWCYSGRPERWFVAENVTAPFPDDRVFAVYLDSRMRIYQSRAEKVAEDDRASPVDWQSRYGGLVWKSTF